MPSFRYFRPAGSRRSARRVLAACAASLLALLAAAPVAFPSDASGSSGGPKEFLVGFERGVGRGEQVALVGRQGADIEGTLRGRALVISASRAQAGRLSRREEVRYVEPNATVRALAPLPVTDPQLSDLWGIKGIDAPAGWAKMTQTTEVVVAVSDTGIWAVHEDLHSRLWTNAGEVPGDSVDNDHNGIVDDVHGADFSNGRSSGETDDVYGHGTHVAGTIGAEAYNNLGVVGVAPYVRLMNARFLDGSGFGSTDDAVRSIDYAADNGARIINCSWGSSSYSNAIYDAIARARAKGVLIVAAAGNSTVNADQNPMYPAAYNSTNIISVAATTSAGALASFSNWGSTSVDLGAPGQNIRSSVVNGGNGYMSGTSMAAPHVSGVAAVLWGERPELSYWNIRRAILGGGSPLPALSGKTVTGRLANLSGSIDFLNSLTPEPLPTEPSPPAEPAPPSPPPPSNPGFKPVLLESPRISGSPNAPSNLSCDGGTWKESIDVHIRWMRGSDVIGYGPYYATADKDIGLPLYCRGIAYNNFGSTTADSAQVPIGGTPRTPLVRLGGSSIIKQGSKAFRCSEGRWSGAQRFEYSWVVDGKEVGNSRVLKFGSRWRGRRVVCLVVAHGQDGGSQTSLSRPMKIPKK